MLSSFYRRLVCRVILSVFGLSLAWFVMSFYLCLVCHWLGLSSACYDIVLFIVLL